ncbi:hypothetical protein LT330_002307 [Penicillium expansum]|nr:hypothetical protein LT330_002307 [Penicillium expansum]
MSLPDPLVDSHNCPVFLRGCNAYREYLLKTEARELKLPPYTTASLNPAGQAIVYHGEVFCRVPSCTHKHWYNSLFKAEENDGHEDSDENGDENGDVDRVVKDDDEEYAEDDDDDYDEDDD